MKNITLFAILILFLVNHVESFSDEFGLNFSASSTSIDAAINKLANIEFCCQEFQSGNGIGFGIGTFYLFNFSHEFGINFKMNYHSILSNLIFSDKQIINLTGIDTTGIIEHKLDFRTKQLNFGIGLNYFYDDFYFSLGMEFSNFLTMEINYIEKIIEPFDKGVFKDSGKRTRNEQNDNYSKTQFVYLPYLESGFYLQISNIHPIFISPNLSISYTLNDWLTDNSIKGLNWNLGLKFIYKKR